MKWDDIHMHSKGHEVCELAFHELRASIYWLDMLLPSLVPWSHSDHVAWV